MPLVLPKSRLLAPTGFPPAWEHLGTFDLSQLASDDWTSAGGNFTLNGVTFTSMNHGKCPSNFGPNGSTGVAMTQSLSGVRDSNTSPGFTTALSNLGSLVDGDEFSATMKVTASGSWGDFGRVGMAVSDSAYLVGGAMYRTSPGRYEPGCVTGPSQYTDLSAALSGASSVLIEAIFSASGVEIYDRGAWTGVWPTTRGGTVADAIGLLAGAPSLTRRPRLSAATFEVLTYRTAGTTQVVIEGLDFWKRSKQ